MTSLTPHVPSLDTCQKLKAAGFGQETYFQYVGKALWDEMMQDEFGDLPRNKGKKWVAAPLVSELMEALPGKARLHGFDFHFEILKRDDDCKDSPYIVNARFIYTGEILTRFRNKNLAEALAQTYLYLKENNLL